MSPSNEQTVQILDEHYKEAWRKFEESHNSYMSLLNSDSVAFYEAVEQFNLLYEVTVYLHNYEVTRSNRYVSETSPRGSVKREHVYAESVASHRSSVSRVSELSSRSSVKEKRIEAAKANLALRLAEQEQRRVMEGELRLHEIERKQRELARRQKLEVEELEQCRRLEALKLDRQEAC